MCYCCTHSCRIVGAASSCITVEPFVLMVATTALQSVARSQNLPGKLPWRTSAIATTTHPLVDELDHEVLIPTTTSKTHKLNLGRSMMLRYRCPVCEEQKPGVFPCVLFLKLGNKLVSPRTEPHGEVCPAHRFGHWLLRDQDLSDLRAGSHSGQCSPMAQGQNGTGAGQRQRKAPNMQWTFSPTSPSMFSHLLG